MYTEQEQAEYRAKNRLVLMSFVNYCAANPELRFWQALAGWSGFCIFAGHDPEYTLQHAPVKDTFHWIGHRG